MCSVVENDIERLQCYDLESGRGDLRRLQDEARIKLLADTESGRAALRKWSVENPINLPRVGDVEDGYRYVGGDPASQGSWQPLE